MGDILPDFPMDSTTENNHGPLDTFCCQDKNCPKHGVRGENHPHRQATTTEFLGGKLIYREAFFVKRRWGLAYCSR